MKKIIIIVATIVIIIAIAIFSVYMKNVDTYKEKVENIVITEPKLNNISDGSYIGECNVDFIKAKVEVEIEDHKFKNITLLKHENGKGSKAEVIPQKVIDAQCLKVDTITGATNSSKVILKAISNALS